MAEIGWIDFSNEDRKKADQLLSLTRTEGQLDELGIGVARDAIANLLFPGISTIQTRAKYFFLITYIFRDYLNGKRRNRRIQPLESYLLQVENSIKNELKKRYGSREGLGIIGVTLAERQYLKRPPSEIYWAGLQTFSFMNDDELSLRQLISNINKHQPLALSRNEDGADDFDAAFENVLPIHTPVNLNWFQNLSLELEDAEADFFKSRIRGLLKSHPSSPLPLITQLGPLQDAFLEASSFEQFAVEANALCSNNQVKLAIGIAHDFALVMEGLHLLYNHMLQEHFFPSDYEGIFENQWLAWNEAWRSNLLIERGFVNEPLFNEFLGKHKETRGFIIQLFELLRSIGPSDAPTQKMRYQVRAREQHVKQRKSRLNKPITANVDVKLNKRMGLSLLQYRFANAKVILKDILQLSNTHAESI